MNSIESRRKPARALLPAAIVRPERGLNPQSASVSELDPHEGFLKHGHRVDFHPADETGLVVLGVELAEPLNIIVIARLGVGLAPAPVGALR